MGKLSSIRVIGLTGFLLIMVGCAANNADTDYQANFDFSQLTSYQFVNENSLKQLQNELLNERIQLAIISELDKKSFRQVDTNADMQVRYSSFSTDKPSNSSISIGIGSGSRSGRMSTGIGIGTTIPIGGDDAYLEISIAMYQNSKLIWRGNDQMSYPQSDTPEERQLRINKTVANILKQFPPL
ncbi:DUF4136 domain-containing protein [Thalassotalea maritima]|uniref:DUF4136 domain-containing protein n=1 Tax=Thalassotalea maritima TaxID=3242416 RepID=UPI0035274A61